MNPITFALLLFFQTASSIPPVAANSLAGKKVELPRDLRGPVSILIVGFSQKSSDQATEWGKAMDALDPCHGERVMWYQLPVIASAPGFVRPIIMHSMKSGLSPEAQQHFIPITDHEEAWKQAAGYSNQQKDDAYLVAADSHGQILAKWHGPVQSSSQELKTLFPQYCRTP